MKDLLTENDYLFSQNILESLDFEVFENLRLLKDGKLGAELRLRPLSREDVLSEEGGLCGLLSQLTMLGDATKETLAESFEKMKNSNSTYFIVVLEDEKMKRLAAAGTLIVQRSIMNELVAAGRKRKNMARLEDIVVSSEYRGRKLGKVMVEVLVALADRLKIERVQLDCKEKLRGFYSLFGFEVVEETKHLVWRIKN